jgi:hypothetical protein
MKLTASPFDPQTGELLAVYRDAYLNGDLTRSSAKAVEEYLHRDADQAHDTLNRWQQLRHLGYKSKCNTSGLSLSASVAAQLPW